MSQIKQPFIVIENLTFKVMDEETNIVEAYESSIYGFTSKFYLLSSFTIMFLLGALADHLLLK